MVKTFDIVQYNTNPDGNDAEKTNIIIGIIITMGFCLGSVIVSFVWKYIVIAIKTDDKRIFQRRLTISVDGKSITFLLKK